MDMFSTVLITLLAFVLITFLYWKLTNGYVKKLYGKPLWKQWGAKMYYWTTAIAVSGPLTVLLIYVVKNVKF